MGEVSLPVEEAEVSVEEAVVEPVKAPKPDRSAYNCPSCKGEGLVVDNFEDGGFVRCPQCLGTGKV